MFEAGCEGMRRKYGLEVTHTRSWCAVSNTHCLHASTCTVLEDFIFLCLQAPRLKSATSNGNTPPLWFGYLGWEGGGGSGREECGYVYFYII